MGGRACSKLPSATYLSKLTPSFHASEVHRAGTLVGGKYRLLWVLGRGAYGVVWEAENELVGRRVAIKILNSWVARLSNMVERFHAEARISATLEHAHVVDIYDYGVSDDGSPFIVMEVLEGETLEMVLEHRGRLPHGDACNIMVQVLHTLVRAHDLGIVHRDLKPANIMLTYPHPADLRIKVLDFGAAQGCASDEANPMGDGLFGTPWYMSPEQASCEKVDARSDLYSAAVVLYEALSGEHPTGGNNLNMVFVNLLATQPAPLSAFVPNLPRDLAAMIMASLAKNPADRPQSAQQVLDVLARYATSSPATGVPSVERALLLTRRKAAPRPHRRVLELVPTLPPPPGDESDARRDVG